MNNKTKKIGIVTLHGYSNYGNKLQNYALQETINSLGYEANTVIIRTKENTDNILIRRTKTLFKTSPKKVIRILIKRREQKFFYKRNKKLIDNRIRAFKNFSKKYLNEIFYHDIDNIAQDYQYFITGSDQVWNPHYINNIDKYFLTFAHKRQRISYAASFGVSTLPDEYIKNYGLWLSQMEHISVREEAGASIVYELTGREIKVLVDPTLMLDKNMWLSVAKTSKGKPNNPYILTYFLGEISQEIEAFINKIKKEYNLEVIHLVDINDPVRYVAGPGEFLNYINLSEIFLTDSFHGAVFSILFKKPFAICDRISNTPSMGSRIETLLIKFKLEDRKWENIKDSDNPFDIDFSHISPILEFERKKSLDYLKNALNIKDEN